MDGRVRGTDEEIAPLAPRAWTAKGSAPVAPGYGEGIAAPGVLEGVQPSEPAWGDRVKTAKLMAALSVVAATVVAGCGGSSSSSSSSAPAASSATTPTQSASTSTASAAATAAPAALITTKHDKLGTILAYGPKHLTVYLFEADKAGASSCSGACAKFWPPVTGDPKPEGQARAADLGTIKRADGSTQVTYKGHPLYLFVKDKDNGDAYGQSVKAFGASWYVLAPSGTKVDNS